MTVPISLTNVTTFVNDTSAATAVNNNSAAITTAFNAALDTQGDTMDGDLNMNSNHIINLPAPSSNTEPLRVIDAVTLNGGGTITVQGIPSGGTTGQVLAKSSNTNYATAWENPPAVSSASIGELGVYTGTATISGAPDANLTNGALTLGLSSSVQGTLTLAGSTSGAGTIQFPGAAGTGTLTFPAGTTNFAATGGTSQVVKQTSAGGAFTVGQLAASDLSNTTTGTGAVVLANNPTFTGSNFITLADVVQETQGYSILGNQTGSTANYAPFQLGQLANKTAPTSADLLLIADEASGGALKYSTISQAIAAVSSGVLTLNGLSGVLTDTDIGGGVITSSGTAITTGQPGGSINKFRNGTMDLWQRGTTVNVTASTTGAYTADGWIVVATGATVPVTQQGGRGPTLHSLRATGASSVTDVVVKQRIESFMAAPMTGAIVTVQAQVYNNTGGAVVPKLTVKHAGTTDTWTSPTTDINAVSLQSCANASWTNVAYVFTDAGSASNGLEISFDFGNNFGTNTQYIQITELDIRVTPGATSGAVTSTPPPPELRLIGAEGPINYRYFWRNTPGAGGNTLAIGLAGSATVGDYLYTFPVPMLSTTPSFSISAATDWSNAGAGSTQQGSSVTSVSTCATSALFSLTSSSFGSTGQAVLFQARSSSSYIQSTSEL